MKPDNFQAYEAYFVNPPDNKPRVQFSRFRTEYEIPRRRTLASPQIERLLTWGSKFRPVKSVTSSPRLVPNSFSNSTVDSGVDEDLPSLDYDSSSSDALYSPILSPLEDQTSPVKIPQRYGSRHSSYTQPLPDSTDNIVTSNPQQSYLQNSAISRIPSVRIDGLSMEDVFVELERKLSISGIEGDFNAAAVPSTPIQDVEISKESQPQSNPHNRPSSLIYNRQSISSLASISTISSEEPVVQLASAVSRFVPAGRRSHLPPIRIPLAEATSPTRSSFCNRPDTHDTPTSPAFPCSPPSFSADKFKGKLVIPSISVIPPASELSIQQLQRTLPPVTERKYSHRRGDTVYPRKSRPTIFRDPSLPPSPSFSSSSSADTLASASSLSLVDKSNLPDEEDGDLLIGEMLLRLSRPHTPPPFNDNLERRKISPESPDIHSRSALDKISRAARQSLDLQSNSKILRTEDGRKGSARSTPPKAPRKAPTLLQSTRPRNCRAKTLPPTIISCSSPSSPTEWIDGSQ